MNGPMTEARLAKGRCKKCRIFWTWEVTELNFDEDCPVCGQALTRTNTHCRDPVRSIEEYRKGAAENA